MGLYGQPAIISLDSWGGNQQYRNVMTMVTNNVAAVSATYAHTLILKRMVLSMEQEPIAAIS